jgi:hypothetical protein
MPNVLGEEDCFSKYIGERYKRSKLYIYVSDASPAIARHSLTRQYKRSSLTIPKISGVIITDTNTCELSTMRRMHKASCSAR